MLPSARQASLGEVERRRRDLCDQWEHDAAELLDAYELELRVEWTKTGVPKWVVVGYESRLELLEWWPATGAWKRCRTLTGGTLMSWEHVVDVAVEIAYPAAPEPGSCVYGLWGRHG